MKPGHIVVDPGNRPISVVSFDARRRMSAAVRVIRASVLPCSTSQIGMDLTGKNRSVWLQTFGRTAVGVHILLPRSLAVPQGCGASNGAERDGQVI